MRFWLTIKDDCSSCPILCYLEKCCPLTTPWEFPTKANHVRNALYQVLKLGYEQPSGRESSCAFYYSQVGGLGLHVVYITHYVITITKHFRNNRNRKAIIEIELNRKEYLNSNQWSIINAACSDWLNRCWAICYSPLVRKALGFRRQKGLKSS